MFFLKVFFNEEFNSSIFSLYSFCKVYFYLITHIINSFKNVKNCTFNYYLLFIGANPLIYTIFNPGMISIILYLLKNINENIFSLLFKTIKLVNILHFYCKLNSYLDFNIDNEIFFNSLN
jgi:hypothetical protein